MKKHSLVPINNSYSFHSATRDCRVFSPVNKLCPDMDMHYEEVTETAGNSRTKHIFDNYLIWPSSYFYEEGDFAGCFYEPMNRRQPHFGRLARVLSAKRQPGKESIRREAAA